MAALAVSQAGYAEDGVPFVVKTTPSQIAAGTIIQGRQVPTWRVDSSPAAVDPDTRYTPPSTGSIPFRGRDLPPVDPVANPQAAPSASSSNGLSLSRTSGFSASARDPAVAAVPRNAAEARTYADNTIATPGAGQAPQPAHKRSTDSRSLPPPTAAAQANPAVTLAEASSASGANPANAEFAVAGGQRLSTALRDFLSANHMRMQWNTRADFVVQHPYHLTGSTFQETLRQVLAAYGLSATIWQANGVVEVYTRDGEAK